MASYSFGDQENKTFELVPDGDYILEVIACEFGLTKKGDDKMELKVRVESNPNCSFFETLTFTKAAEWKIDTFVKSTNLLIAGEKPKKGEAIDFSAGLVVGLRGWATVGRESFVGKDGKQKTKNKVAVWLTDREKLPKAVEESEDDLTDETEDDNVPY